MKYEFIYIGEIVMYRMHTSASVLLPVYTYVCFSVCLPAYFYCCVSIGTTSVL